MPRALGGAGGRAADARAPVPARRARSRPSGAARRVEWARRTGGLVIEDDYDGEFRYDRQPVGALQALAPEHVVYAGTASKSLAPGLRLGWLALPAALVDDVVAAKERGDRQSSALDQLTLAEFIDGGRATTGMCAARGSPTGADGPAGRRASATGPGRPSHRNRRRPPRARQPASQRAGRRCRHARRPARPRTRRARRLPLAGPRHEPALVVGYGTPPEHAFTTALARLIAVLG